MSFVMNCAMTSKLTESQIIDWKIQGLNPPSVTFREFFSLSLANALKESNYKQLYGVYVGKNKIDFDLVDMDLRMYDVMAVFGRYVKFVVE